MVARTANEPEAAREKYRALFDTEGKYVRNAAGDVEGYRFPFDWGNIVISHPNRGGKAMADQLEQRGEGLYAITLAVEDLNRVMGGLRTRGVKFERDGNGFLISPAAACGARIRLAQG